MTIFAITSQQGNSELFEKVKLAYPDDNCMKVDDTLILVHSEDEGLAEQVCEKILDHAVLNEDSPFGRFIICSITSYYGWHFMPMWDWLQDKGV